MLPIDPLPRCHTARPLIAWALFILPKASPTLYDSVLLRLSQLVLDPPSLDLRAIAQLLDSPAELFDICKIISSIVAHADLFNIDPEFDWDCLDLPPPPAPVTASDLPWCMREEARFLLGEYAQLPWSEHLPPIPNHYAHLSSAKPGLVAYTQDADKGEADKQTQIRPGRYLTRFYSDLSAADVRRYVNGVPRPATLAFARTADEIEKVYVEGPRSCMTQPAGCYDSQCHPVRVYGDSDLMLAYAVPPDGLPTARALVWPEKKRYSRIYGDEALIEPLLHDAGYVFGSLSGARIRRIPADTDGDIDDDNAVVMPYLDGSRSFNVVDADWLAIDGPYPATNTNGIAYLAERYRCDGCGDYAGELYDVGPDNWCESCRENDAFVSEYSDEHFSYSVQCDVIVSRIDGENFIACWAECERDEYATLCNATQEYYQTNRFEFVERNNDETWVAWYAEEHPEDEADIPRAAPPEADNDNVAIEERDAP